MSLVRIINKIKVPSAHLVIRDGERLVEDRRINIAELDRRRSKEIDRQGGEYACLGCGHPLRPRFPTTNNDKSIRRHFYHSDPERKCDIDDEQTYLASAHAAFDKYRQVDLPPVPLHPDDPDGPTTKDGYRAYPDASKPSSLVIGTWESGSPLAGSTPPVAVITERDQPDSPIAIRLVVRTEIDPEDVEQAQREGYRLLAIIMPEDNPEEARRQPLDQYIVFDAERVWLAHPEWMAIREGEWNARTQRRNQVLLARNYRIRKIYDWIIKCRDTDGWMPVDKIDLQRTVRDHGLRSLIGHHFPHDHWMAGKPAWWQAALIRLAILHPAALEVEGPILIPSVEHILRYIKGYLIPFTNPIDPDLIEVLGRSEVTWGTADDAISEFLEHLHSQGWLVTQGNQYALSDHAASIARRNAEIDRLIGGVHEQGVDGDRDSVRLHISNWKEEPFDGIPRWKHIIYGGERWNSVLEDARSYSEERMATLETVIDEIKCLEPEASMSIVADLPADEDKPPLSDVVEDENARDMTNPVLQPATNDSVQLGERTPIPPSSAIGTFSSSLRMQPLRDTSTPATSKGQMARSYKDVGASGWSPRLNNRTAETRKAEKKVKLSTFNKADPNDYFQNVLKENSSKGDDVGSS